MKKREFKDYLQLMSLSKIITSLWIIIGVVYITKFNFLKIDLIKLFLVVILFTLFYSGIYMINDIVDYEKDSKNKEKLLKKPIARGFISRKKAFLLALVIMILISGISAILIKELVIFEIIALIYNLVYSLVIKKIPFLDTLVGGFTHSLRGFTGAFLFGNVNFETYLMAIVVFLFSTGAIFFKRLRELEGKESVNRPLKYYSKKNIKIIQIILLALIIIISVFVKNYDRLWILLAVVSYSLLLIFYDNKKRAYRLIKGAVQ